MATYTGTAGAVQVASDLTVEVKTYYLLTLLERALPQLYHCSFAQKASIPQGAGGTVEWRKFSSLTATSTALVEGVTPSSEGTSITNVTATPSWYGAYIRYSDVLDLTSIDNVVEEYTAMLGEQAGDSADRLARALYIASGTEQIVGQSAVGSITSTDIMTASEIAEAWATLVAANARPFEEIDGKYACIIHPHVWYDLYEDAEFRNAVQQAMPRSEDHPLFTGEQWDYMGIRFFVTSNAYYAADAGSGAVDVYYTMVIGRNAFGIAGIGATGFNMDLGMGGTGNSVMPVEIIFKELGSEGSGDPLNQRASIGWKASQEEVELNSAFSIRIESASSLGSNS